MKNVLDIPRTAMEVFELLPEGTACEVIDNTLYMSPSPTTIHQRLLGKLFGKIQSFAEEHNIGEVIVSPCDVYLNDGQNVVQPDIFFVRKDREHIIETKGIYGAPDLVIEILSTNKDHDQQRKMELYRLSSVTEYIIIDPDTKNIWSYLLNGSTTYEEKILPPGKLFISQFNLILEF